MSDDLRHVIRHPSTADASGWGRWAHLRRGLAHAFALGGEQDRLQTSDLEFLDRIARLLAKRELSTPAIFIVESLAPLGFLGSQLVHALAPVIEMVASPDDIERLGRLLEHRDTPALFTDRLRFMDETGPINSGQPFHRP